MPGRTLWEIEQALAKAKEMSGQERRAWLLDINADIEQWGACRLEDSTPEEKVRWLDIIEELGDLLPDVCGPLAGPRSAARARES